MTAAQRPILPAALLLLACSGADPTRGLTEPFRVDGAQFREGALPGDPDGSASENGPSITTLQAPTVVAPGTHDRAISGRASPGAASIGLRFEDIGSGYWILPTGNADVVNQNELLWGGSASYAREPVAGKHTLLATAFDASGRAGPQASVEVCLLPQVPDNGNICNPAKDPPKLVVSLAWNRPVDLDLRVVVPSGKIVDAKRPTSGSKDVDGVLDPLEGTGRIAFDSNAGCELDGQQRESLVFQDHPPAGAYLIYANLFEPCGEPSVEFTASVHASAPDGEHFKQVETLRESGGLQAVHANSGAGLGLFITQFVIQ